MSAIFIDHRRISSLASGSGFNERQKIYIEQIAAINLWMPWMDEKKSRL